MSLTSNAAPAGSIAAAIRENLRHGRRRRRLGDQPGTPAVVEQVGHSQYARQLEPAHRGDRRDRPVQRAVGREQGRVDEQRAAAASVPCGRRVPPAARTRPGRAIQPQPTPRMLTHGPPNTGSVLVGRPTRLVVTLAPAPRNACRTASAWTASSPTSARRQAVLTSCPRQRPSSSLTLSSGAPRRPVVPKNLTLIVTFPVPDVLTLNRRPRRCPTLDGDPTRYRGDLGRGWGWRDRRWWRWLLVVLGGVGEIDVGGVGDVDADGDDVTVPAPGTC